MHSFPLTVYLHTFTDEQFKAVLESESNKLKGHLTQDLEQTLTKLSVGDTTLEKANFTVTFDLFVCKDDVCSMEKKTLIQELNLKQPEDVLLTLEVD